MYRKVTGVVAFTSAALYVLAVSLIFYRGAVQYSAEIERRQSLPEASERYPDCRFIIIIDSGQCRIREVGEFLYVLSLIRNGESPSDTENGYTYEISLYRYGDKLATVQAKEVPRTSRSRIITFGSLEIMIIAATDRSFAVSVENTDRSFSLVSEDCMNGLGSVAYVPEVLEDKPSEGIVLTYDFSKTVWLWFTPEGMYLQTTWKELSSQAPESSPVVPIPEKGNTAELRMILPSNPQVTANISNCGSGLFRTSFTLTTDTPSRAH